MKRQFLLLTFFFSLFAFQEVKAQNCDTSKVTLNYFNPGPFPPTNQIDFNCLDSALTLQVTPHIDCNSIASDGSNFKVILPNGDIVKAIFAEARNCIGDSSNAIFVRLEQPLFLNMLGKLAIGKSANQSTIKSNCAQRPWDLDTINIAVQGCFITRFDTVQTTQTASQNVELNWVTMQNPPTAPFPVYLFSSFKIYRKTSSDHQFQLIDSISDFYQTSFSDNNFPTDFIGKVDYFISIKLLNIEVAFSDTVSLNVVSKTEPLAYPVPFQKELNLALGGDDAKEINIFSSEGKLIFTQKTNAFYLKIATDAWPKGVYLIRVRGKEEIAQKVAKF